MRGLFYILVGGLKQRCGSKPYEDSRTPRLEHSKDKWSAGVAQLVEHNLAKVGVESSSLFSRSIKKYEK